MDDQNQANNQFGNNQPKKDEPADVTTSAPVEMEPSTSGPMPPVAPPTPGQPSASPSQPTQAPSMPQAPVSPGMPAQPEEKKLEMPPQPALLEAPQKKSGMFIALIAVVLVIALALLGFFVYQAMY
jgi:uncharacterized protein HemX